MGNYYPVLTKGLCSWHVTLIITIVVKTISVPTSHKTFAFHIMYSKKHHTSQLLRPFMSVLNNNGGFSCKHYHLQQNQHDRTQENSHLSSANSAKNKHFVLKFDHRYIQIGTVLLIIEFTSMCIYIIYHHTFHRPRTTTYLSSPSHQTLAPIINFFVNHS